MRKVVFVLLAGVFVSIGGCGVPESKLQQVMAERDACESNMLNVQKENDSLKEEILKLRSENNTLKDQIAKLTLELEQSREAPPPKPAPKPQERQEPPPAKPRFYEVQKGDTLWSISRRTGVPLDTLRELNNIQGSQITPGQKLRLTR